MKRVLFLLCSLIFSVYAADNYLTDYKQALAKAKTENKLLALTVVQNNCPWCIKFENETLKHKAVSATIKEKFVHVVLNRDTQEIPHGFKARLVPTTFFVNANGEKVADNAIGFFDGKDFMDFLNDAVKKGKK